jgi:UDP-N-acetyl-2-amino-2-deoxyglucuronate dehydrogenase
MRTIHFAIIGCGHIGRRYARLLQQQAHAQVVALADTDATALEAVMVTAERFTSLEWLLAAPVWNTIDIVVIATPNYLHAQQAIQCLQAGKHVIVEKPMALHSTDAKAITEAAANCNKKLFVVMQNRYNPLLQWLRQVVQDGTLGAIHLVKTNCFWNRDERYYTTGNWHGNAQQDGGTLFTQFSHFLDAVYWIFGKMEVVQASFANLAHQHLVEFEDTGLLHFRLNSGGLCTFDYSTAVYRENYEGSITVFAENGTVRIGGTYLNRLEHAGIRNYTVPPLEAVAPNNDYGAVQGSAGYHGVMLQHIIGHLHDPSLPFINTPGEGCAVIELIEEVYRLRDQPASLPGH